MSRWKLCLAGFVLTTLAQLSAPAPSSAATCVNQCNTNYTICMLHYSWGYCYPRLQTCLQGCPVN